MIAASEWKAYNDAVAQISDTAESEVKEALLAWHAQHPDATVAETREYARLLMDSKVQSYDSLASSFAAEWYDYQAERGGARLDQAVTASVYVPKSVEEVARYQAKKLVAGDFAAFAKACGEYARNDSLRSLNQTILANAKRDGKKGVRFARVASGHNTCSFCLMLCSRGAVYHSRKTAGEFSKFHRGCSCKVVPGFEDDPMAVLVEGHDPNDALRQWQRIEDAEVLSANLYDSTPEKIQEEADAFDRMAKKLWKTGLDEISDMISSVGTVGFEPHAVPKGKELQQAKWLASLGWSPIFRDDTTHLVLDGNTSDLLIDGKTWDLKRISSNNPNKIAQNIFKKKWQGPNFVVDLSLSDMTENTALSKCASILDDERVEQILLIVSKKAVLLKK
jgi:hypothetical protein